MVITASVPSSADLAAVQEALLAVAVTAGCTARESVTRQRATDTTMLIRRRSPTADFEVEVSCETGEENRQ